MGYHRSSPERDVYGITGIPQEARKIPNKQSNSTPKSTRKRITKKPQSKQKEKNSKEQSGNK